MSICLTVFCLVHSWSYGILLYEIVTLGSSPYPSIAKNEDLLKHLQEKKRMDQPNTCSNELYVYKFSSFFQL